MGAEQQSLAREYSVYITDAGGTRKGSGALYYEGTGDTFYVFTCAHVLDGMDEIHLRILLPEDVENDAYDEYEYHVPHSQVTYSPIDQVRQDEFDPEIKYHSCDIAVICVKMHQTMHLKKSIYFLGNAKRDTEVYGMGYPAGCRDGEYLLSEQDVFQAKVILNNPKEVTFKMRLEDDFLNHSSREAEMAGFSGAPVWDDEEEKLCMYGLLASGERSNIYRGRVNASKIQYVHSIMKNHFGVWMENKLQGIPESDIAPKVQERVVCDGSRAVNEGKVYGGSTPTESSELYDKYLAEEIDKAVTLIDLLQIKNALELCKSVEAGTNPAGCSRNLLLQFYDKYAFCYQITRKYEEHAALLEQMRRNGIQFEREAVRQAELCFEQRDYERMYTFAKEAAGKNPGGSLEQLFLCIAEIYLDENAGPEAMQAIIDDREVLRLMPESKEIESLIYQMIGYVYEEHFHLHQKAIRCLNRAYRIDGNLVTLETLASGYYAYALRDAEFGDEKINFLKIDMRSLWKARECYLRVLDAADEMYQQAMLERTGFQMYKTFVYLQDNYWIRKLYPAVREIWGRTEEHLLREIDLGYAELAVKMGKRDFSDMTGLTDADRRVLDSLAVTEEMLRKRDANMGQSPVRDVFEKELAAAVKRVEENLAYLQGEERIATSVNLLNLYGIGSSEFRWNRVTRMKELLEEIPKNEQYSYLKECMEIFVFEQNADFEAAEERYRELFETYQNSLSYTEWMHFYTRQGHEEQVEALYRNVFTKYPRLAAQEPEFICRAYIDFCMKNKKDLTGAIECFVANRDNFHDKHVMRFWEMKLMAGANVFNHPEVFEEDLKMYVEEGIISPEGVRGMIFGAYVSNLNCEEAWKYMPQAVITHPMELAFLVWQGKLAPRKEEDRRGIIPERIEKMEELYELEQQNTEVMSDGEILKEMDFELERTVAMDAWALYLAAESGWLERLRKLDCVYVTHLTVTRILHELMKKENLPLRLVLDYLEHGGNVRLQSPELAKQLEIRRQMPYSEPAGTICLAAVKNIPAVIGDMDAGELPEMYRQRIVRPFMSFPFILDNFGRNL